MTSGDILGLVLSYIYATSMLVIVQLVGKRLGWPAFATRKIIHIGAGMWVWGILILFDHWYFGVIPFATFIGINALLYRTRMLDMMDEPDSSPGTIYFALSITLLFALLWRTGGAIDRVAIAVAGVMAMTWGDAMAALIGKPYGKRTYTFFGHTRTLEGSLAFVIFAGLGIFLTLFLLPGSSLSPDHLLLRSPLLIGIGGLAVGATAEALSPAGTDNLTVPLLSGLVMWLLSGI